MVSNLVGGVKFYRVHKLRLAIYQIFFPFLPESISIMIRENRWYKYGSTLGRADCHFGPVEDKHSRERLHDDYVDAVF